MENQLLKKTPLLEQHISLGAKIVDFAGWSMPVQYSGVIEEHLTVRNKVGLFDVSHMGTFKIEGSGAYAFIQKMIPNDLNRITIGKAIYTQLCNPDGGVIDDLLIYYIGINKFKMVVNASNVEKDFAWLQKNLNVFDVNLENISSETAVLALQGPLAEKTLAKICNYNLPGLTSFCLTETEVSEIPVMLARTGYTGEDGFELIFNNQESVKIWNALLKAGEEFDIKPIGLGARDTLRLEANLPLYGHELNMETSPLEAKLGWSVKLEKGNFIGKDALVNQKEKGLKKKIIGLKGLSRAVFREGYEVSFENEVIGKISSGTFSPTLNYPVALAYVKNDREYKIGEQLNVLIRGKYHTAEIVTLPFYRRIK